jgi:hypothetical protein
VETVPGVTTTITIPKDGNSYPTLTVLRDEAHFGLPLPARKKKNEEKRRSERAMKESRL